jgi:hypothetical protein
MKRTILQAILMVMLLATAGVMAQDTAEPVLGVRGVDAASASIMLEAHNEWRRDAGVPDLIWSETLAKTAQAWADHLAKDGCLMEHSSDRMFGENLAWATARRLSPDRVVSLWGHEKEHYDLEKNRCAENQICGHYTQMVWEDTREVGCGHAICGGAEVWVCHYYPQGNLPGETPY